MSTVPTQYPSPLPIRSAIFKKPPDGVPSVEELEGLQAELKLLKQRTLERARKAGEDMRMIDESMRRIKEREKGKAKAIDKVKIERGFTPQLDGDNYSFTAHSPPLNHRTRLPSVSSTSSTPYPSRPAPESHKSFDDNKKKKKRKRDIVDSEGEPESQRPRKASPVPTVQTSAHSSISHLHPSKPLKVPIIPPTSTKGAGGQDWATPSTSSMVPVRPPPSAPPTHGPLKVTDVQADFSQVKAPSTTAFATFMTYLEPWTRNIKEEDVGLLEFIPDDLEAFIMPTLGRHYSQVWHDEDTALYGGPLPGTAAVDPVPGPSKPPLKAHPKWEPASLADDDLVGEDRGNGPLTERLVSALLPTPDSVVWKGVKAAEEAMEGRSAGGANAAAARDSMTIGALEDRVRDSMRFLGLIEETTDPSAYEHVDDPISTALRQCQRLLRPVIAANKARKRRLLTSARDRVAYNEYVDGRDALDKNITSIYTKLWNKDQPHIEEKKDKKKKSAPKIPTLPKHAAAHGLLLDDELNLVVPDNLKQLAATRRLWVDQVGKCFDAIEADHPGRIRSFPRSSVYEGIEEEVREEVERVPKWQPILRQPSPEPEPSGDAATLAAAEAAAMDAVELPDNWLDMDMEDIGAAMDLA